MSRIIMEKKICLEPKYLDDKIPDHLLEKINSDILGKCDQSYGYVTKVFKKIQIIKNVLSTCGPGVFFYVKFGAEVFKPIVGSIYEGKVCMTSPHGIFVEVFGKMKVLIPVNKMSGYKFDKAGPSFKKGKKTILEKDTVEILIDMIKYEKQNFNCIGSLKIT
jgi:DNA-directed RNA polymerase subunit E'/Rpb7